MRRHSFLVAFVAVAVLFVAGSARADLITFQQVNPLLWDVIYGPGPASTAVGGFDIDIMYNAAAVAPSGVTFDVFLGGAADTFTTAFLNGPFLTVQELSFLTNAELIGMQPASFRLFQIAFTDLGGAGGAGLQVATADLSDGFGNPIGVPAIPEPGTMILLGSGLAALAKWRKKLA